jgi:putative lipoic acid-binding regulatory protein
MMKDESQTLLEFPCDFPIKAMGPQIPEFRERVIEILQTHLELDEARLSERPSSNGRYLAITYVARAESQDQLDAIYRELTACELVAMAL